MSAERQARRLRAAMCLIGFISAFVGIWLVADVGHALVAGGALLLLIAFIAEVEGGHG